MGGCLNPYICMAGEGGFSKDLREPLPDLFQIPPHAKPTLAVGASNKNKL